jgi:hypothetical protein
MEDTNVGGKRESHSNTSGQAAACPRALARGLLLEDRQVLLPWGARRFHLTGDCQPDRLEHHISWDELTWDEPVLLRGLKVAHVQVVLYPYGWLDEVWIWVERGNCLQAATNAYHLACDHLARLLGQPFFPPPEEQCDTYLALAAWEWQDTRIALYLRTGDEFAGYTYCTLAHIAHR